MKPFFLSHWNYLMRQRSCIGLTKHPKNSQREWEHDKTERKLWVGAAQRLHSLSILHAAPHTHRFFLSNCLLNSYISRNGVFTCMWFTVRTNPNQSMWSLSTLRATLRWVSFYTTVNFTEALLFTKNTFSLFLPPDRISGSSWVTGCSSMTCSSNLFRGSWSISYCWRFAL